MIKVGTRVEFDPFKNLNGYGVETIRGITTGTVVYINYEHRWFSVAYGDNWRASFKFDDIDSEVKVCG